MATSSATNELPFQLAAEDLDKLFRTAAASSSRSAGWGDPDALYSTVLANYDRFGANTMLPNHESVGYTFITRPKLNLSTASLRMDRILAMLDTADTNSQQFAIRCWLDTHLTGRKENKPYVTQSPFYNDESPFLIPLSNNLVSISGWPDLVVDTETTDGGFFSEDLTFAKGSDRMNRTANLTLTFRDVQGGFVLALLYIWIWYIALVARGDVTAYPEDINNRRINYTCSIYRFVMDPSKQFITKWAKATGCFPVSPPIGNAFNFGDREKFITSTAQYSVPFVANKVEYWDPIIFRDFNTIMKRHCGTLNTYANASPAEQQLMLSGMNNTNNYLAQATGNNQTTAIPNPTNNFVGNPFVDLLGGYNRLLWIADPASLQDPYTADWITLQSKVSQNNTAANATIQSATPGTTQYSTYA